MVLLQNIRYFLGLAAVGERGEAAQVEEHDNDLAPVCLQQVLAAAIDDRLGNLRRKEAFQSRQAVELRQLLLNALLELPVPFGELRRLRSNLVTQHLLLERCADARA